MKASQFADFLQRLTPGFTRVLEPVSSPQEYVAIDLSESNHELEAINISSSEDFTNYVDDFLERSGKKIAYGGYGEIRKLYQRSELFQASADARDVHFGLDLWAPAGTAVVAVLDGKIHSFKDNANFGDYGPTIILEHEVEGAVFYSLYGHLSRKSLAGLTEGQLVKQGEKIADLGTPAENGDYASHLHFQLIRDLQGKKGDYPGVASRNNLDFFLNNCPNPNLLLKIT